MRSSCCAHAQHVDRQQLSRRLPPIPPRGAVMRGRRGPLMRRFGMRTQAAVSELEQLEIDLSLGLFSRVLPDYRVVAGAKATAFPDQVAAGVGARAIDPAHSFFQLSEPAQVATPVADPLFGGRAAMRFTGAQRYISTLSPADWGFASNGTGIDVHVIWYPTSNAATQCLFGTNNGIHGSIWYWSLNGGSNTRMQTASAAFISPAASSKAFALNTPKHLRVSYKEGLSPEFQATENGVQFWGGPSSTDPSSTTVATMTLGAAGSSTGGGAFPANAAVAEYMFANSVDAALRTKIERYVLLKYGI